MREGAPVTIRKGSFGTWYATRSNAAGQVVWKAPIANPEVLEPEPGGEAA